MKISLLASLGLGNTFKAFEETLPRPQPIQSFSSLCACQRMWTGHQKSPLVIAVCPGYIQASMSRPCWKMEIRLKKLLILLFWSKHYKSLVKWMVKYTYSSLSFFYLKIIKIYFKYSYQEPDEYCTVWPENVSWTSGPSWWAQLVISSSRSTFGKPGWSGCWGSSHGTKAFHGSHRKLWKNSEGWVPNLYILVPAMWVLGPIT